MSQELRDTQLFEFKTDFSEIEGVCFDAETVTLQGIYSDELSIYRARKQWIATLESNFLLEKDRDFSFSTYKCIASARFILQCEFLTACGRYAFWRLTNNQAPHVQYQIETAHIPDSFSRHADFISAPDLQPVEKSPLSKRSHYPAKRSSFSSLIQGLVKRISDPDSKIRT